MSNTKDNDSSLLVEMQEKGMGILEFLDDFCKKNDLKYCMVGGTLLGSIRHNGFIPWDDDIDVAMPREDYERFLLLSRKIDGNYVVEEKGVDDSYVYPYAKIYDTKTTVVENYVRPFSRGVWIDVFPLDGCFKNRIIRKAHFRIVNFFKGVLSTKSLAYSLNEDRGKLRIRKIIYIIFYFIRDKEIYRVLNFFLKLKKYKNSEYVGNLVGRWGEREIMHKDVFEIFGKSEFNGRFFSSPNRCDEYLKNLYGQYMELPPMEKRKSGHDFLYVNLDIEYERK